LNFVGKFDAKLPVDGPVAHSVTHVDGASTHAPSDAIIVPDAQLLFGGDFKRSGVDLILSDDHHELVLHDYFKGEKRVALASPDGAHLTGDLVDALAGHVDYAQADGAVAAAVVVGHVTKLTGSATAIRNGVSIILNQGDNIDKGDVLQSGADSTLGVTFIDGTVFGLSSNARMVVNEMVYDPNGSNNSSLLSLVAGTISFVAGETAKHGDMKVDTPVATMGIRGTAVLVEIDFSVPGANGAPSASFEVLEEPDGTTGSYILFDKNTLAPLATVNTANTLTRISDGVVSFQAGTPLTADQQKLIFDLFTAKFGDTNTKSFDHFTDTITPQSLTPINLPGGVTATPIVLIVTNPISSSSSGPSSSASPVPHVPGAPLVVSFNQSFTEHLNVTGSHTLDTVSDVVSFLDVNIGDRPTVKVEFSSFTYKDAHNNDITAALTPQEQAAVAAVEGISVQQNAGNNNNGSATWTYSFPDGAFDFLGAGETLTLTYTALVDNNYAQSPETGSTTFTITITGTNDVPVITSSIPQTIAFVGGTSVPGGDLTAHVPTSGTISFDDPDLTDTHTVSVQLLTAGLPPTPQQIFENALSASIVADSTGTGFGTINWKLAELPVYLADFIPKGQTITLTYAVTVTDSQGATATQDITVTITGTDTPAVVWIATTTTGSAPGGLWSDASNWETGTVPTATDDAIIITNQLIGLTPSYPVTIDAKTAAVANSVTMNDFGTSPPELINLGTLTVGGAFDMSADSILQNSGTISVGGLMEVLDTSVLLNAGTLTLKGGGDFGGTSTIANTGTIEISAGTLTVQVDIANTGGTIVVDGAGTLNLDSGAIDGGTINDGTAGSTSTPAVFGNIDVTGSSTIENAQLNFGEVTVESGVTLKLNNDTVTGTTFTDAASGSVIQIGDGTTLNLSGVTINGGTINDGTAGGTGRIDVTGNSTISGASLNNGSVTVGAAKLTLDNDTVSGTSFSETTSGSMISVDAGDFLTLAGIDAITGVPGSIANSGLIDVTGTTTLTTGKLTNTGTGTLQVDGTLNLSGATLSGGTITDNGTIDVTGDSTISGASLNHGGVTLSGKTLKLDNDTVTGTSFTDTASGSVIQVDDGTTLNLSGVTINGGTINDGTATGSIDVTGDSTISGASLNHGGVTLSGTTLKLDNDTVSGTSFTDTASGSVIQIGDGTTLTLSGVTISGGAVNDGTAGGTGDIDVTGSSTIGNAHLNNGNVTIDSDQTLTLGGDTVSGTSFTAAASGAIIQIDGADTLDGVTITGGTVANTDAALTVDSGQMLTLQDGATIVGGTLANSGTVEIEGSLGLTLDGVHVTGSGTIQIDQDTSSTQPPLILEGGTTFTDGTLTVGDAGVLDVETATGGTLDDETVTNKNAIEVFAGSVLTLDNGTVVTNSGVITVDGTLTLSGATINGGTITDNSLIDITGDSTINGNAALNGGQVKVESAKLTLDNVTVTSTSFGETTSGSSIISVDAGDFLTLAGIDSITGVSGSSIANAGLIEVTGTTTLTTDQLTDTSAGILQVDAGSQLNLSGATINGGTITDNSLIDITGDSTINGNAALNGGQVKVESAKLTLDNVTATSTSFGETTTSGSIISVDAGDFLTLAGTDSITGVSGSSIANAGLIEVTGTTTLTTDQLTDTSAGILRVDAGAQLNLSGATINGGTITDNGTINVTGAVRLAGAILDGATGGTGTIDNTGTLTIGNGGITLAGSNFTLDLEGSGTIALNGRTIKNSLSGDSLENNGNTISGTGKIGTGNDGMTPLSVNNVSGTIEAIGGTLFISNGTFLANSGLLEAANTGILEFTIGGILNNGTDPSASSNASGILVDGTLEIDNSPSSASGGSLSFGGYGQGIVALAGGTIEGSSNAETLFNFNNLISGYGNIGLGTDLLTLHNDAAGVIDANVSGQMISIDTVATINAGLIEATGGGTLQIESSVSNSGLIEANGGKVFVESTATITGNSSVTITNGGVAEFAGSSAEMLVLNATFSGYGILELDNSQHYGGTVTGFGAGDTIDLTDLTYSPTETDVWNSLTHTLTITDGTNISNIMFSGTYGQNSFALTSDAHGDTEVVSSPAQAVLSGLDSASNAVEGFAVVATLTPAIGVTYQWLDNGVAIPGATGSSYLPTAADLGKTLDVVVGYTDGSAGHVTTLAGTVAVAPEVAINPDDTTTNENSALTLHTLNMSFGDAGSDSISVTLDVSHGTLALGSMAGVSESGSCTSSFILTGTLAEIDTALANGLVYTPTTGYYGTDTLTFEANDGTFHSNTATDAINVTPLPPVLNGMTLIVVQGGTEVLTDADFSVTDPNSSSFLYTVNDVTGGQFEVFNGSNWVSAPTGGFTTAQIEAGHVEFVQDGSLTTPQFSISASDGIAVSQAIAPTVNFVAAPPASLEFDGHSAAVGSVATSHVGNAAGGSADGITLQGWVDWSGQGGLGSSQLLFYNGSTSDAGFGLNGVVTANGLDLQIQHGGTAGTDMNITLSAGQWYDLALTHVNGVFTLYVDGVAEFTDTESVNSIGIRGHHQDYTLIGGNSNPNGDVDEGFHGSISDVSVWNTALTQSQVQADEFTALQGHESGLAAYFPLDEGSGTTVHDLTHGAGNLTLTGDTPVWQTASHSIAGGGALELSGAVASDQGVTFQASTGKLTLDKPSSFHGEISGFTGDGTLSGSDQIDLKGINYNSNSFTESFNATNDTLSVSDGTHNAVLHFNGTYQAANFSFTTDNNGGTIVYDPPVADNSGAKTQAVTATSHGFVFNFADNSHDAANASHPVADTHVFDGQPFANAEANLNKLHDDSHGDAATPPDSLDALTAAGIKAQLHAHDFHFV
jgi:fibronectin-binding autotransporter adhesin